MIKRLDGYYFPGTQQEWWQLHLARTQGKFIRRRTREGVQRRPMAASDNWCTPTAPCNACADWARQKVIANEQE
jgi:hypothetical protein